MAYKIHKSWDFLPKNWGGAYSTTISQAIKRLEDRANSKDMVSTLKPKVLD